MTITRKEFDKARDLELKRMSEEALARRVQAKNDRNNIRALNDEILLPIQNYLIGKCRISSHEIAKEVFPGARKNVKFFRRVSRIMKYLKWIKGVYSFQGKVLNGYYWPGVEVYKG